MESPIAGYDAANAMLLNEFLKEHRKVEELEKQIEKLAAGLQNVGALGRNASGRTTNGRRRFSNAAML